MSSIIANKFICFIVYPVMCSIHFTLYHWTTINSLASQKKKTERVDRIDSRIKEWPHDILKYSLWFKLIFPNWFGWISINKGEKTICKQVNEKHSFELKINGNKIKYFSVLSLTKVQAKPVAINVINYTDREPRAEK